MTAENVLQSEIDVTLEEMIEAERVERETRLVHSAAQERVSKLDQRARNLRLALYRLTGEKGEAGDANVDNNRRKSAIARGEASPWTGAE